MIRFFYKFLLLLVVISSNTSVYSKTHSAFSTLAPISGLQNLDLTLEELRTYETDLLKFLNTSDTATFKDIYQYLQKKSRSGISSTTLSHWLSETICDTKIMRIFAFDESNKLYESFQPYEKALLTHNYEWAFISLSDINKAIRKNNQNSQPIQDNITNFDMISGGRVGIFILENNIKRDQAPDQIKIFLDKNTDSPVLERAKILQTYKSVINHAPNSKKEKLNNEYQALINVMEQLHYYIDEFKDQQTDTQKRIELLKAFKVANKMAKNKADILSIIASLFQFAPDMIDSLVDNKDCLLTLDQLKIIEHKIKQSKIINKDYFFSEYILNPEKYKQTDKDGELITKGHALQNYFHMLISESSDINEEADPDIMLMVLLTELENIKDDPTLKGDKLNNRIEYLIPLAESLGRNIIADKLRDIQIQRNHPIEYIKIKNAIENVFGLNYETLYSTLYGEIVPKLKNRLKEEFPDYSFKIRARIKSIYSLENKIKIYAKKHDIDLNDPKAKEKIINFIFDIIGLQVIFDTPEYIRKDEKKLNKEQKEIINIIQDEFSDERKKIRKLESEILRLQAQADPLNKFQILKLQNEISIQTEKLNQNIEQKMMEDKGYSEMKTTLIWKQNGGIMRGEFQVMSSYDLSLYKYGADVTLQRAIAHSLWKLKKENHIFDLEIAEKLSQQFTDDYHNDFKLLFNEIKKYTFVKVAVKDEEKKWFFKYLRLPKGAIAAGAAAARTITNNLSDRYQGYTLINNYSIENGNLHISLKDQTPSIKSETRQVRNGDTFFFYSNNEQSIKQGTSSIIIKYSKTIRAMLRAILIKDYPVIMNIEAFENRLKSELGKDTDIDEIISKSLNRFHLKANKEFYQMLYYINTFEKEKGKKDFILAIARRFFEDSLEIKDPVKTIEDLKNSLNLKDSTSHLEIMATLVAANFRGRSIIEKQMKNVSINNKYGKKEPLLASWQKILHKFLIKQTEVSSKEILYNRVGLNLISQEEILMNIHRANEFRYTATATIPEGQSLREFMFKFEKAGFHILNYHTNKENNITFNIVSPIIFAKKYIAKPADMNAFADKLVKIFEKRNKEIKIEHQYRVINLLIPRHEMIKSSDIIEQFAKCNLKITNVNEGLLIEAPSKCNIEILKNHLIKKFRIKYSQAYLQNSININKISSITAEEMIAQAA